MESRPSSCHHIRVRRYERTAKINAFKDEHIDKSRSEGSSKSQDSKKDNKSDRAANHDQKKAPGGKKDQKSSFAIWKDKLSEAIREYRSKEKACYKCGLSGHQTRDCTAKEQALHNTQAILNAAKNK